LNVLFVLSALVARTWITEKIRARIQSEYAERLETLKVQLKAEADVEIEKFKSQAAIEIEKLKGQLNTAAAEHQVRFSKLHEKRAEVIAEIYSLLVKVHSTVEDYIGSHGLGGAFKPPLEQRHEAALNALGALGDFFAPRRIFVPKGIADRIGDIHSKYSATSWQFFFEVQLGKQRSDPQKEAEWKRAAESIATLSKTAAADLEQEFRILLGDDTGKVS